MSASAFHIIDGLAADSTHMISILPLVRCLFATNGWSIQLLSEGCCLDVQFKLSTEVISCESLRFHKCVL